MFCSVTAAAALDVTVRVLVMVTLRELTGPVQTASHPARVYIVTPVQIGHGQTASHQQKRTESGVTGGSQIVLHIAVSYLRFNSGMHTPLPVFCVEGWPSTFLLFYRFAMGLVLKPQLSLYTTSSLSAFECES